jgi:hypothetical protein
MTCSSLTLLDLRPSGNVTGITNTEPSIGGKWLQLLKEMAPVVTRSASLINPDNQPDRGAVFLIRSMLPTALWA